MDNKATVVAVRCFLSVEMDSLCCVDLPSVIPSHRVPG